MTSDEPVTPGAYEVWQRSPLVVGAVIDHPGDATTVADQLAASHPDERFIGIISAEDDHAVDATVVGLRPRLAELIFTASSSPRALDGSTLAWHALDALGVGQDFVYTVPRLGDAIRYGLEVLAEHDGRGWEGTALLVPGTASTVDEARQIIRSLRR